MNFYEDLFKELAQEGIHYLVVGGVAVILHGFVRATADLDIMIALDEENLNKFIRKMKEKGYKPKAPVPIEDFSNPEKRKSWIKDKGMKVFSLYHPKKLEELIDVFIEEQIPFKEAYSRKKISMIGETPINIVHISDLINLKKKSGRPQDLQDIEGLEYIFRNTPK